MVSCALSGVQMRPRTNSGHSLTRFSVPLLPKPHVRVKTEAARILHERKINPEGHELDRQKLGRTNLITLKAAIDRHVAAAVGRKLRERSEFTQPQLDQIDAQFDAIVGRAIQEVLNASN
jgi:hypothetical protein